MMTTQNHILFWSFVSLAFLGFVFVFKVMLLPFVLGAAVAYLLNPLVEKLGRLKIGRGLAALLILASFIIVVVGFFAATVPVLYSELVDFSEDLPGYMEHIWALIEPFSHQLQNLMGLQNGEDLKALLGEHAGTGLNVAKQLAGSLAAGGQAAMDMLSVIVFTPVVAYFMMKEWTHMAAWMEGLMPEHSQSTIKILLRDIDAKLSGFVRGQISVAVVLGIAYAAALSIAGLKYGALIGFSAGLLSIIPMVGSTLGLLVSVAVAWFQAGEWSFVAIIAGIFLVGQFIEGNVLTPKLVGGSVGLHPLWVFFALLAGGSLFGIVGMLLAVPVAAVIGVLLGFGLARYKASAYFKGKSKAAPKKTVTKKAVKKAPKKASKNEG